MFSSATVKIRFDYGAGNTGLTPTIGISMGDGQHFAFPSYDNAATLTNANSILWTLPPGFVDMGAYEFEGSSTDTTPPLLTATNPTAIQSGGTAAPLSQIALTFSKPLDVIDALAPTDYQLIGAGPDGVFGTADDVAYTLVPQYTPGSIQVTLVDPAGYLPSGLYQLTVFGAASGGIHDLSGNLLDGDANGTPGGNYVRTFTLGLPQLDTITGTSGADTITLMLDADHMHVDWTLGAAGGQLLINDPNGLTINGNGGNDVIDLVYSSGNPLPTTLHLNGTFTINNLQGTNPAGQHDAGHWPQHCPHQLQRASDPIAAIKNGPFEGRL